MRTNVTVDSDLIEQVQKYTDCKTKAKAVVLVMEEFLKWKKIEQVIRYKGKLSLRHDTATARKKTR